MEILGMLLGALVSPSVKQGAAWINMHKTYRIVASPSKCDICCYYCYHSSPLSFTHVHVSLILNAKQSLPLTSQASTPSTVLSPPAQPCFLKKLVVLTCAILPLPLPTSAWPLSSLPLQCCTFQVARAGRQPLD